MKISTSGISIKKSVNIGIEKINISKKYCIFKKTFNTVVEKKVSSKNKEEFIEPKETVYVSAGVCTISDFNKSVHEGEEPKSISFEIFSNEQFSLLAKFGWGLVFYNDSFSNKMISYSKDVKEPTEYEAGFNFHDLFIKNSIFDEKEHNIFDFILENPDKVNNIVVMDYSSHTAKFLLNEKTVPMAIHMDYIDAHLHNKKYNLDKAFEILKNRGNVSFVVDKSSKKENLIKQIPYYNCDNGRSSYIECYIELSQDEVDKIEEERKKIKKYPSTATHSLIWQLDILGLKEADRNPISFYNYFEDEDEEL